MTGANVLTIRLSFRLVEGATSYYTIKLNQIPRKTVLFKQYTQNFAEDL